MAEPRHDWYLKQWLKTCRKIQADIEKDLGWNKARVSLTANGHQPYTRDDINEIADYLNIRPYELLMHPDDAMALRQLRASAGQIAAAVAEHPEELAGLREWAKTRTDALERPSHRRIRGAG